MEHPSKAIRFLSRVAGRLSARLWLWMLPVAAASGLFVWLLMWQPEELRYQDDNSQRLFLEEILPAFWPPQRDTLFFNYNSYFPGLDSNYIHPFQFDSAHSAFFPAPVQRMSPNGLGCIFPITSFPAYPHGSVFIARGGGPGGCMDAVYAFFFQKMSFRGKPFVLADSVRESGRIRYRSSYLWNLSNMQPLCLQVIREARPGANGPEAVTVRYLLVDLSRCRPDTVSADSDYVFARWGYLTRTGRTF